MSLNDPVPSRSEEPTIRHVADVAGVSIGTVSNVLNHPDRVSQATIDRVRAAIVEVGFIRNEAARSLASGSSDAVGLIVPDLTNSLFVDMAKGAQVAAKEYGLSVLVANADDDFNQQDRYLDFFAEARASGILLAPMHDSSRGITRVREHGRKVVVVNFDYPTVSSCNVLMDNQAVGRIVVEHLVELGFQRIVFVSVEDFVQPVRERHIGVQEEARRQGVPLEEIRVATFDYSEGFRAAGVIAEAFMAHRERVGVVAVTDGLAVGVLEGLLADGRLRVPEDVGLAGMDGNRTHWRAPITMTSVALPGFQVGVESMRLLLDELNSPHHEHRQVVFPVSLIPRESTLGSARPVTSS